MITSTPDVYACKNKDDCIRSVSTSGGVFSIIAAEEINHGGSVLAVRFDDNFCPIYDFADSIEDIDKFRGSKYVQAVLSKEIIAKLKERLKQGKTVMIIGTPCTINGLSLMLKQYRAQLLFIDFVCMGIAPMKIWKTYLDQAFSGEKIEKIIFKEKSNGWRNYSFFVQTNQRIFTEKGKSNLYMQGYLNKLYLRPSCYNCKCKGLDRTSDITIADCWGIENYFPDFDDDKGISSVFLNNDIGKKVFAQIKDQFVFVKFPFESAVKENHYYFDSAEKNYYTDKFFKDFLEFPDIKTIDKYRYKTRPVWVKLINRFKSINTKKRRLL